MSPFGKKSFDSSKCVSLLEVTQKRIGILRKKRSIVAKQSRDDVAKLLERGQDANAAARAEHVFREENVVAAYELLERHCQIVIKGISAIRSEKGCSLELKEAIASLVYAAPRCGDLQELQKVRDIFISRYGAEYVSAILELQPECAVNTQIIQSLSSRPPNSDVRLNLLKEIASEHKINWNYQRAVAASFKNGESSENSKISLNAKLASKENRTDNTISSIPVDTNPKPALAAQPPTPAKASINKSEPSESVKPKQPVDVSENFDNKPGHKGQASFAARHNLVPSMAHDISPRERGLMVANRGSSKGSPKMIDTFMHQEIESKEIASFASRSSSSSTVPKIEPRRGDFGDLEHVSPAEIQQHDSSVMHQDDKLKSHPSSEASNLRARHKDHFASSREILDLGVPSKVNPSLFPAEERTSERPSSALQSALGSRALPSRTKASPVQSSSANMSVSAGELGGPLQQKALASKPERHPISNPQADGIGESLAAKQYVRAHQNYAKVDSARTHEDFRGKKLSQIKLQPKQGDIVPAADITVDSHPESISINQFKDYNSVHRQTKRSSKALNREELNNSEKNDAVGQMKGTYQQRVFDSAEIHERSRRGKEGVEWTSSYAHARNQQEEKSSDHQKHSTIPGPNAMHSIPPVELRSMKVDVDQELAELETAIASAARAADTAIEMLRTCSIKSRADKKGVQRERNSQARMSYGDVSSETRFESSKGFCKTLNQQENFVREKLYPRSTAKGDLDHKEPCQEQEPVTLDSEMPHFDDSSDDSTSDELPPYSKSRRSLTNNHACADLRKESDLFTKLSATPFGVYSWNDRRRETLQVSAQRNLQGTFCDDDCAESVDSFSPKSAATSQHPSNPENFTDVQSAYKTQLEDYEEPDNVRAWSAALQSRNNAYAAGEKVSRGSHGLKDDRVSNMKLSNENVGKGVLRWEGLSTGDVSKKKWTLGNAQSHSQPYKQHQGMATQNMADKFQGVSRRSLRSVGPT
ncbi:hypothetical protein L7F22_050089 [Adiantum nelumboides]|nr:hypothetical protein [Adiantum nelumboides]